MWCLRRQISTNSTISWAQKGLFTLPWACDPELHRRLEVPKKYPISFIGTFYPARYLLLKELREFKEKIHIFGNHWVIKPAQVFPPVYGEDYVKGGKPKRNKPQYSPPQRY